MASNPPSPSSSSSPPCPAKTQCVAEDEQEEDQYISMEVSSSSSSNAREFEFQMSSLSHDRGSIPSPADELFYKGKLLPLHLPPRLQMVQKLLDSTNNGALEDPFEEIDVVSHAESCRASSEINPDEYFFEWSSEANGFVSENQNSRKFQSLYKKIKQSQLGRKIKASRAYLRSLFNKSACSDESCAKPVEEDEEEAEEKVSKPRSCLNRYVPFGQIDNDRYRISKNSLFKAIDHKDKVFVVEECVNNVQRRSFSGAIKWHYAPKCSSSSTASSSSASSSSSSFSFSSSSGYYDLHLLKRSNSANSELESSIEGAIAHCKQSSSCLVQERESL